MVCVAFLPVWLSGLGMGWLLMYHIGKHACPGRHLALVVVKLFLLEFLERFEFKEVERPKDWQLGFMFNAVPDMKTNVWIRPRREDVEVGA